MSCLNQKYIIEGQFVVNLKAKSDFKIRYDDRTHDLENFSKTKRLRYQFLEIAS